MLVHVLLLALSNYSSASLLLDSTLGLTEVLWHSEPSHIYVGSPSILRLSNGDLLATADRFGSGFQGLRNVSVHLSTNNGTDWRFLSWCLDQYWSNLFSLDGSDDVYLLGTSSDGPSPIKISKSTDGGRTWVGSIIFGESHGNQSYETGPTPALISQGRVFRAMERMRPPYNWGTDYEAVVVHASVDDDLLDPKSWTISASMPFDKVCVLRTQSSSLLSMCMLSCST
jgi:hypothetical protein